MTARLAVAALLLALAACATGPAYPLLTPLTTAKEFGYAETPRGGDRYSITYITPTDFTQPGVPRDIDADAARALGYDMALWRAAQLASGAGFAGFHVSDRQADVTFFPDQLDLEFPQPLWAPGSWRVGLPMWQEGGQWLPPRLLVSAKVTIEVRLLHAPGAEDVVAADTIARLAKTYPGADAPPAANKP
jgi:hypothetical protein